MFRRIFKPLWKRPKIRRRNNYEDNIFKIPFENKGKEKRSQLQRMSPQIQVSCLIRFWQKLHFEAFFRTFGNFKKSLQGPILASTGTTMKKMKESIRCPKSKG